MNSPQEVLQEHLNGINNVLEQDPPKEELKELNRLKTMFISSIWSIEHGLNKANDNNSRDRIFTTAGKISAIIQSQDVEIDILKKKYDKKLKQMHVLQMNNHNLKTAVRKLREQRKKFKITNQ